MAADSATSPLARAALIAAVVLALYVGAYFPAMSYVARQPPASVVRRSPSMVFMTRHRPASAWLAPWRPLPHPVRQALHGVWSRIDPKGNDLLNDWH